MSKRVKSAPAFASEAEETAFGETHDSADHVDWSKAQRIVLPKLKPTTHTISLRLPQTCSTPSRPQPTRATCRISR